MNRGSQEIDHRRKSHRSRRQLAWASLLLGTLILTVACEPVPHYNRLQAAILIKGLPRRPYGSVHVFQFADEVNRPYQPVGILSCDGTPGEEAGILNAMLYRAADMGADAIVLNGPRSDAGGAPLDVGATWVTPMIPVSGLYRTTYRRGYRAQAIRFKD